MYSSVLFRSLLVLFMSCLFLQLVTSRSKLNDKLKTKTKIIYNNLSICRGPKLINLTKYTVIMERHEKDFLAVVNMTVFEAIVVDELRMMVYAQNQKVKTLLWNFKLKNPCKNFGFALLLKDFNSTNNCEIKQGTYYARVSMADFVQKSVGTASTLLLNGENSFKMLVLSKQGNVFCLTGDMAFEENK